MFREVVLGILTLVAHALTDTFAASLRLCSADSNECHDRVYPHVPVEGTWASTCDTLGNIETPSFASGVKVDRFWFWVSAGQQNGSRVEVTLYSGAYCTGLPIEFNDSHQGRFLATQIPDSGSPGWALDGATVRSARVTAFGDYDAGARKVGVKLVVFPLLDMDESLGTMDEYTCAADRFHDIGLGNDSRHKWPSRCASPIDRVYCIDREPGPNAWGAVDDWPTYGFDFADNWDIPKAFNGTFPIGSVFMDRYTSSWTGHAPCTDPHAFDPFEPLPRGTCVVTKLYEKSCKEVAISIAAWSTATPQYIVRQGGVLSCLNAASGGSLCSDPPDGAGYLWQPIRCAWTRVVDGDDCSGKVGAPKLSAQ